MEGSNGSAVADRDYEEHARGAVLRVWDQPVQYPPKMWALLLMVNAVVYALLEIARAIRDAKS